MRGVAAHLAFRRRAIVKEPSAKRWLWRSNGSPKSICFPPFRRQLNIERFSPSPGRRLNYQRFITFPRTFLSHRNYRSHPVIHVIILPLVLTVHCFTVFLSFPSNYLCLRIPAVGNRINLDHFQSVHPIPLGVSARASHAHSPLSGLIQCY